MSLSPIAIFVYNRPDHTKRTIEALKKNELAAISDLFVFSDGPKDNNLSRSQVAEVRQYLKTISGFKSVKIIERLENQGLAKSIIAGVTEIVNIFGRVIVLEDDMITSQYFLQYMNEALDFYNNDDRVISIHAYIYPIKEKLPETFFLRGADCWGWATWKRGWDLFESDGQKLLDELKSEKLIKEFNFSGSYPYVQMLQGQIAGRNNSWAIRWYASAFLKNKLTLYPGKSLINNIGFDGSGTHCSGISKVGGEIAVDNIQIKIGQIEVRENPEARWAVINYFKSQNGLAIRSLRYLRMILKKIIK